MSHFALLKVGLFASAEPSVAPPSLLSPLLRRRTDGRKEASVLLVQLQLKLHINIHA